jgi:nitrogenase molybdenum-cofactor synthesis protein NifE
MTDVMNPLSKSVTLKQFVTEKKLPDIVAPIFPGLGCGFFAVSFVAPLIAKSAAIMIAPALCAHNARVFMSRFEQSSLMIENNLVFFLYEEEDIIHGAEETIRTSLIEYCNLHNPDVLFVVTSCLPEIVGEDIEAVVRQVRETVAIPILFIRTENFTNISSKQGIKRAFEALIELIEHPDLKIPNSINIIGRSGIRSGDTELIRVLTQAGIIIHSIIPSRSEVTTLQKASQASYNLVLDRGALPLAEKMKEKFKMNYFFFDHPFSPDVILEQYKKLGSFLSVDLEPIIHPQYEILSRIVASLKLQLSNKKVILSIGRGRAFDLGFLLHSLGLEISVIAIDEAYEEDFEDAQKLYTAGGLPDIIRNASCYPLEEYLQLIKPDFYLTFSGFEEKLCQENQITFGNIHRSAFLNGFEFSILTLSEVFSPYLTILHELNTNSFQRGISP